MCSKIITRVIRYLGRKIWRPDYNLKSERYSNRKVERWSEYEVLDPRDAYLHSDHDTVWTSAPGVWCCKTCHEWYRTWEDTPKRDIRQGTKKGFAVSY